MEEEENFFNVAGEQFYFDLDKISEFIKLEKPNDDIDDIFKEKSDLMDSDESNESVDDILPLEEGFNQMIDITKWELTKAMIETVLSENNEVDESMGFKKLESQLSIPFRISFNTLLINKILKKNG